jgi:hypothetical protein
LKKARQGLRAYRKIWTGERDTKRNLRSQKAFNRSEREFQAWKADSRRMTAEERKSADQFVLAQLSSH